MADDLKLCPLTYHERQHGNGHLVIGMNTCKEECAWRDGDGCAMEIAAASLRACAEALAALSKR